MKSAKKSMVQNFHLPLAPELYQMLREEAEASGKPATTIARDALEIWLRLQNRKRLHDEIADYASQMSGTGADLDEELEAASIESLSEDER